MELSSVEIVAFSYTRLNLLRTVGGTSVLSPKEAYHRRIMTIIVMKPDSLRILLVYSIDDHG